MSIIKYSIEVKIWNFELGSTPHIAIWMTNWLGAINQVLGIDLFASINLMIIC